MIISPSSPSPPQSTVPATALQRAVTAPPAAKAPHPIPAVAPQTITPRTLATADVTAHVAADAEVAASQSTALVAINRLESTARETRSFNILSAVYLVMDHEYIAKININNNK